MQGPLALRLGLVGIMLGALLTLAVLPSPRIQTVSASDIRSGGADLQEP